MHCSHGNFYSYHRGNNYFLKNYLHTVNTIVFMTSNIKCHFCGSAFTCPQADIYSYIQVCGGYCVYACKQCRDDTSHNLHVKNGTLAECEFDYADDDKKI